jgi:hypothetical protein
MKFRYKLHKNDKFSVDSIYRAFIQPEVLVDNNNNNKILKKIPLKTKVFACYLRGGVILTKVSLVKRNCHGSRKYIFCHYDETIKQLVFKCVFLIDFLIQNMYSMHLIDFWIQSFANILDILRHLLKAH